MVAAVETESEEDTRSKDQRRWDEKFFEALDAIPDRLVRVDYARWIPAPINTWFD